MHVGVSVLLSLTRLSGVWRRQVSTEVSGELSELVAAPSQTVCFMARTYNDAIAEYYQSDDTRPRPVSGCPQPTPPLHPRPPTAATRPVTAAASREVSDSASASAVSRPVVRRFSDDSPFVETLVNLTLHSQLQNVELLNVDEMLELAATILQSRCDDRCALRGCRVITG